MVSVVARSAVSAIACRYWLALVLAEVGAAQQEVGRAADHRHQIVEVVGDAAGELAERLQLLRLDQRGARFLELLLRSDALGDVAGDLGEADVLAVLVEDRVDQHVRPEQGAVLAHALRLALILALGERGLERPLGLAGGAVLLGVEAREMLADDLSRPNSP